MKLLLGCELVCPGQRALSLAQKFRTATNVLFCDAGRIQGGNRTPFYLRSALIRGQVSGTGTLLGYAVSWFPEHHPCQMQIKTVNAWKALPRRNSLTRHTSGRSEAGHLTGAESRATAHGPTRLGKPASPGSRENRAQSGAERVLILSGQSTGIAVAAHGNFFGKCSPCQNR